MPRRAVQALGLLAAAMLAACGGGGTSGTPGDPPPASAPEGLATAQPGEVLAYVKRKLESRGPIGLGAGDIVFTAWMDVVATTSTTAVTSRSGTVVQEAGVDEEDLIKAAADRLYTLQPLWSKSPAPEVQAQLDVHGLDAAGKARRLGSLQIGSAQGQWTQVRGMVLAEGQPRLVVVTESVDNGVLVPDCAALVCGTMILPWLPSTPYVNLYLVDARQPDAMPRPQHWQIDGSLVGTRQVGNTLYVVATHTPRLAFDQLPATSKPDERQTVLDRLTVAELLPKIRINGGAAQPLVADTDCWLQPENASMEVAVTTITAVDLGSADGARTSRCFVGGSEALYVAPQNLYLATTRNEVTIQSGLLRFAPEMRTDIHKFAIAGSAVAYRASGSVAGSLGWDRERRPYRMSEHDGRLRVLSFTGSVGWISVEDATRTAASPATLSILGEADGRAQLQTLSTLPNARRPEAIGKPGEQVYGVRFVGDRGYVVTFRRTDPLYVLDLSDPADPRRAGELEVPGFSDWLYPVDGGLLLGVGKEADASGRVQGVKVALFDVRDAARPAVLASHSFGGPGSTTGLDYSAHGIGWLTVGDTSRIALPMQLQPSSGGVYRQTVQRFEIDSRTRRLGVKDEIALGSAWADPQHMRVLPRGEQLFMLIDGALSQQDW